jgi:hypothetical protein
MINKLKIVAGKLKKKKKLKVENIKKKNLSIKQDKVSPECGNGLHQVEKKKKNESLIKYAAVICFYYIHMRNDTFDHYT